MPKPSRKTVRPLLSAGCVVSVLFIAAVEARALFTVDVFDATSIGNLEFNGPVPAGTAQMASDPLRGHGWHEIFSELPNDVIRYGYDAKTTVDLQHLVDLLVKIETPQHVVHLDPGPLPTSKFIPVRKNGQAYSVIFSIGNQQILNRWYSNLPVELNKDGKKIRKFGQWEYEDTPPVHPPTLTVYIVDSAFDVNELKVPVAVDLKSGISNWHRKQPELAPAIKQIEKLVSEHAARRK